MIYLDQVYGMKITRMTDIFDVKINFNGSLWRVGDRARKRLSFPLYASL